ncbi:iron-containing alcohol dehydrogenase [Kribbella shirazensis]|uniref:Maleylacetate reductase n=1 Tax=Kribbella shirazensis TaxID=1105143 RepID=A0A7X5V776_9ACTN|nr:maleylacetate reductase [Kribbella shirazensis]
MHTFLPGRVVFGAGALERVGAEVEALGVRRVLVIATNSARAAADAVQTQLGDRFAGRIDGVAQHVPTEAAEQSRTQARESNADAIVAIGGGSAIGLAKAIALTSSPQQSSATGGATTEGSVGGGGVVVVAVPTTYAGSEMTPVWGETAAGRKSTGVDLRVLPRVVVYDPMLSRGLPVKVTAASVANAIAHCVEAVWTPKADPFTEVVAAEGLRALAGGMREVLATPDDLDARGKLMYGACLAGSALATAGTGLHHKLCHLLGGTYNLPHAETHAAVLPQVARVNASSVPQAKARLEAALGTTDLAAGLFDLFQAAGVPTSLRDLGLTEAQAEEAARTFQPTDNPIPVTEGLVREILSRAWAGTRP